MKFLFLNILWVLFNFTSLISSLSDIKSCLSTQYYDLTSYECILCPQNQIPSYDSKYIINNNLI